MNTKNLGLRLEVGPSVTKKEFDSIINDIKSNKLVIYNNNRFRSHEEKHNINILFDYMTNKPKHRYHFQIDSEVYICRDNFFRSCSIYHNTIQGMNYIDIDDLYSLYSKFVLNEEKEIISVEYTIKTNLL